METTKGFLLGSILEKVIQGPNRSEQASLYVCDNERCASIQLLQPHKIQLINN